MSSKGKGALSYLLGLVGGLIVLFAFKDNNRKDVFHACQSITLTIANIACSFIIGIISGVVYAASGVNIPFVGSVVTILFYVLIILGLVKALKDDPDPKLPVIGDLTEKIFEKKINAAPETVAAAPQANFDPNTGQPINQPQANFDPNTGQPINQPAPQANFDPNTGKPVESTNDTPNQNA